MTEIILLKIADGKLQSNKPIIDAKPLGVHLIRTRLKHFVNIVGFLRTARNFLTISSCSVVTKRSLVVHSSGIIVIEIIFRRSLGCSVSPCLVQPCQHKPDTRCCRWCCLSRLRERIDIKYVKDFSVYLRRCGARRNCRVQVGRC